MLMKTWGKLIPLLIFFVILLLTDSALAGEAGTVSCTTPGCGYHANLSIGGGRRSPSITGYCAKTRQFVRVKLKSWEDYRKPQRCPGGKERLQPIYDGSDVSRFPCPKCGNFSLKFQGGRRFD